MLSWKFFYHHISIYLYLTVPKMHKINWFNSKTRINIENQVRITFDFLKINWIPVPFHAYSQIKKNQYEFLMVHAQDEFIFNFQCIVWIRFKHMIRWKLITKSAQMFFGVHLELRIYEINTSKNFFLLLAFNIKFNAKTLISSELQHFSFFCL